MRRMQAALLLMITALASLSGVLAQSAERGAALADVASTSRGAINMTSTTTTATPRTTAVARNNTAPSGIATNASTAAVRFFAPCGASACASCARLLTCVHASSYEGDAAELELRRRRPDVPGR